MKATIRILFAALRTGFALGLLVYLSASGAINWPALQGLAVAWQVTLTALILLFADVVVTSWRLCVLMKPCGLHLSLVSSIQLSLIGNFFSACLPGSTGGDMVKIYYATEGNRGRRTEVATIMLLDRAAGMFALIIWPLLVAPLFPQLVGSSSTLRGLLLGAAVVAAGMIAGILACLLTGEKHKHLVSSILHRLPLGSYIERIFDTVCSYRHNRKTLLATVGISLLAHTMTIGIVLLLIQAINPGGATWSMSILIPLGFLANILPVTPGGLGIGEAAFNKLFEVAGLSGGAEALLGWRMLTILISMIGLVFYLRGRRRFIHRSLALQEGYSGPGSLLQDATEKVF
jgi:uncharacterized protein (TIRG00374 family)